MKKATALALAASILFTAFLTAGCGQKYTKFNGSFFGSFDTYTTVVGYTKTEKEFDQYFQQMESRMRELHKLFDKYNDYEGINNIKTINDNAGIKPVKVDQEIIDLISFSKEWYKKTGGKTNIAMGPVLNIWHQYFEDASYDPAHTKIPPMEDLKAAAEHTDIDKVLVDAKNSTVYLAEKGMSLDVGAVAKGFATEIVAREMKEAGFQSGILSPGGNIYTIGKPLDGIRERWGIGIQDPDKPVINDKENTLDTIYINDAAVVSSGDYQRYYIYEGQTIHHIIDPDTLMPGKNFRAVTVVTKDAGVADFLSTTLFLMTYEEGLTLLDHLDGVEAYWVLPDKSVKMTKGMEAILKSHGATGSKQK
jgi:thiamine biosynthesis lipoprotein